MQTREELYKKLSNIKRNRFNRLMLLIEFSLYTKTKKPTSFAKKFGIESAWDLYNFFKKVKNLLKRDQEDEAFFLLTELSKSAFGRSRSWVIRAFADQIENDVGRASFIAHVFLLRTIGFALDNLRELRVVFKEFEETEFTDKDISGKEVGLSVRR